MSAERLVEIFLQLAPIDACSTKEKPVAEFIKQFLSPFNYKIIEDSSQKFSDSNTGNIICRKGDGGDLILLSHMDTARPTKDLKPVIRDSKIVSNGDTILGADNRAGIAVLLYTLEKVSSENINAKNFTVGFTTCEETNLMGSKKLEINGKVKKGFVFDSAYRPGNFIHSSCGSLSFTIKIHGVASHSALSPERGINSIQIASKALSKIRQGRIDSETTLNVGKIYGGSAVNVVPERTIVEGEIRSFKISKIEDLFNNIKTIFINEAKNMNGYCSFISQWDFEPYNVSSASEVYKEAVGVIEKVGLAPRPQISLAGSDANSLNANGIQAVNLGIGAQNPHSNEEFILIEDLYKSAEIALELVKLS
jgi:tripeptide aminopeptidase